MGDIEQGEYTESSLLKIRKFVTKVWEHPLVTETTRRHRLKLKQKVADLMSKNGMTEKQYIGLPIGSSVWISLSNSDYDVILFGANDEVARKIEEISPVKTGMVDIIASGSVNYIHKINEKWPYYLFYIPDEYITGNLEIAHNIRTSLTDELHPNNRDRFDKYAPDLFKTFFRDWDNDDWYKNYNPLEVGRRKERFNKAFEIRSLQNHNPDRWKNAFAKNLSAIQSPDFTTFSEAMKMSHGALTLINSGKAQGISDVPTLAK